MRQFIVIEQLMPMLSGFDVATVVILIGVYVQNLVGVTAHYGKEDNLYREHLRKGQKAFLNPLPAMFIRLVWIRALIAEEGVPYVSAIVLSRVN